MTLSRIKKFFLKYYNKLSVVVLVIAMAVERKEIQENWNWLEKNLLPTLGELFLTFEIKTIFRFL